MCSGKWAMPSGSNEQKKSCWVVAGTKGEVSADADGSWSTQAGLRLRGHLRAAVLLAEGRVRIRPPPVSLWNLLNSFQEHIFHYLLWLHLDPGIPWLCSKQPPSQRKQGDYARSISFWCACACVRMWQEHLLCACAFVRVWRLYTCVSALAGSLAPFPVSPGEGNGNHSSVLAWRIPGTGEPGGLPSMGLHRVGHDWSDLAAAAASGSSRPISLEPAVSLSWQKCCDPVVKHRY